MTIKDLGKHIFFFSRSHMSVNFFHKTLPLNIQPLMPFSG